MGQWLKLQIWMGRNKKKEKKNLNSNFFEHLKIITSL